MDKFNDILRDEMPDPYKLFNMKMLTKTKCCGMHQDDLPALSHVQLVRLF